MDIAWVLLISAVSFFGAMCGAAVRAYWTKRAENLAAKKDIKELTEIVKRIEAEISEGLRSRQKRWEMKREVLFEAAKGLTEVDETLSDLSVAFSAEINSRADRGHVEDEKRKALRKALGDFGKTNGLVAVTCDQEAYKAFLVFHVRALQIAAGLDTNPNAFEDSRKEWAAALSAARAAIRKELGIEELDEFS